MNQLFVHNSINKIALSAWITFTLAVLLIGSIPSALAQKKYEKEVRIEEADVPMDALKFVNAMLIPSKIKWYKEQGLLQTSLEAKTKYRGEWLSIEFSEQGAFEDLEIQKKPEALEPESYREILAYLETELLHFSIQKIQIQYIGAEEDVLQFFLNGEASEDVELNYEIVLSTKVDGSFEMFEYLFNEDGKFIRKSKIILKMSDNIEY